MAAKLNVVEKERPETGAHSSNTAQEGTRPHDSDELCFTPAVDLAAAIRSRKVSPVELMAAILDRCERLQPRLNCFVTLVADQAMAEARAAEERLMRAPVSELPLLHGIPVTVKDIDDTAGIRTTYGSKHFANNIPDHDSTVWARLKGHGAILVGKTTTPEFGAHCITESPLTGITNNPWNLAYACGGSSGGAAVAVAAGLGPLATGGDGGGSIRVPASFCGVVGLKASAGRIPYNVRGAAWESAGVNGPITRSVADTALMLDAYAGPDPYDAISLPKSEISFLRVIENASVRGLRVAYCPDLDNGPLDPEVNAVVTKAALRFAQDLGAHVETITIKLPDPYDYFHQYWGCFMKLLLEDTLAPLGNPEFTHPMIYEIVRASSHVDLGSYLRSQNTTRSEIFAAFADVFSRYDLLIMPTCPVTPFPHPGPEGGPTEVNGIKVDYPYMQNMRFTEAISHAGFPSITVPAGFTATGLPIGMQIAAGRFQDAAVLRAAAAFETAAPWAHLRPPC